MESHEERLSEEVHLAEVIEIVNKQIEIAKINNAKREEAIIEAKKEMRENTQHSVGNLWSSDNFMRLAEMSQYVQQISAEIDRQEFSAGQISALERMLERPYFARIDFKFEGEDEFEKVYIGRHGLVDEKTVEMHVYDWRSPIAGMFYRFNTGEAYYDAPVGRISGKLSLKRQYEIKKGNLEYFFDVDMQIVDEFLRKLLSQNTSREMKSIVETIQMDQDKIIRDMQSDLMMVQGVAGSGKTSIALHRVAYLMYQGLVNKLTKDNILILSPNELFKKYIARVLPELGEENVSSLTYAELLKEKGYDDYSDIKHVVIDEAQDYDKSHFKMIKKLFPYAKFTILADVNQTIGKLEDMSFYGRIKEIFSMKNSVLIELTKSFRSTKQILEYSKRFIDKSFKVENFNRDGDEPKVYALQNDDEMIGKIEEELLQCAQKGYESIGLLCKTEKDANELYDRLKDKTEVSFIGHAGAKQLDSVMVMPIHMAKGLEFDAVLVCDADTAHYRTENDKKLLYIACTRALHRLNLFCVGQKSVLLKE